MDEYSGIKHSNRSWNTILLPVMGFLLIGASAAIAFVAAEPATELLRDNLRGVPPEDGIQIAVGFGIFLTLLMIFSLFYAIGAPKPKKMDQVSEKELEKEKKARQREKLEQRKRRRAVNLAMAKENRERNQ